MDHNCCKTTLRTEQELKPLYNRLNRIEGQIRGLKRMLEKDAYCLDILTQVSAATAALNGFSKELLSSHIHGCVVRDIQNGKLETTDELMSILEKLL